MILPLAFKVIFINVYIDTTSDNGILFTLAPFMEFTFKAFCWYLLDFVIKRL